METENTGLEIAVIGMDGQFPGAKNLDEFWYNLVNEKEAVVFFSPEELLANGVSSSFIGHPDFVPTDGAIIKDKKGFDASFFGYNAHEATLMEPQIRMFHEFTWKALEDAGYDPSHHEQPIGLYAGSASSAYWQYMMIQNGEMDVKEHFAFEHLMNTDYLCSTVSYKLDLKGPSIAVQTACSTSLVSIHMACQGLLSGDCDIACAGGVFLYHYKSRGYIYQSGMINSSDGHCRAFDAKSNGSIGGEGIGVVVLKRLQDAVRDGDNIHAIIKGSAINNDGNNKVGFTAPSPSGQQRVIEHAMLMSDVQVDSINFVETHGTGTSLGDPIEMQALVNSFIGGKGNRCAISALKPNIGHLGNAAGVASFIKAVLCIKNKIILPILHFKAANSEMDLTNSPFYFPLSPVSLEGLDRPIRACVSSFGIGGTNAHLVLEEAPFIEESLGCVNEQILLLSGKSEKSAMSNRTALLNFIERRPDIRLNDVAVTLQSGRHAFDFREYYVCRSLEEAEAKLKNAQHYFVKSSANTKVVLLYPGQGTQYLNMCKELYEEEHIFKKELDQCIGLFMDLKLNIRDVLFSELDDGKINQTKYSQPIIFSVEYALTKLLFAYGVVPYALIGHSIGEYTAACISGIFTLSDTVLLVYHRAQLMHSIQSKGSMLAVRSPVSDIAQYLTEDLSIASVNTLNDIVLSGIDSAVLTVEKILNELGVPTKRLLTSHAFHSALMDPILGDFKKVLDEIAFNDPKIPFISNVTGNWAVKEEVMSPAYWIDQLRKTVLFFDGAKKIASIENLLCLEVGPGKTLSSFVQATHPEIKAISLIKHPAAPKTKQHSFLNVLGNLWVNGLSINWGKKMSGRRISLPTYQFEHTEYWPEFGQPKSKSASRLAGSNLYDKVWKIDQLHDLTKRNVSSCVIFHNDNEFSDMLTKCIVNSGIEVVIIKKGKSYLRKNESEFELNPENGEDFLKLFNDVFERSYQFDTIIHCWSVEGEGCTSSFDSSQINGVLSLQKIISQLPIEIISQLVIYYMSDPIFNITGSEIILPEKATAVGLVRTSSQEFLGLKCTLVDVGFAGLSGILKRRLCNRLLKEISSDKADRIVAYRNCVRWVEDFCSIALPTPTETRSVWKEKGTYIITGGLGRIGLRLAYWLASKYAARVILISRTLVAEQESETEGTIHARSMAERRYWLTKIEETGAELNIFQADVSDYYAMSRIFEKVESGDRIIDGVIHAAGIVQEKLKEATIQMLSDKDYENHFASKIHASNVLLDLLEKRSGCIVILMSSLSTVLGGIGLSAYASANCYLDSLAEQLRNSSENLWYCINWDGWELDDKNSNENFVSVQEGIDILNAVTQQTTSTCVIVSKESLHEKKHKWDSLSDQPESGKAHNKAIVLARPPLSTNLTPARDELDELIISLWQDFFAAKPLGIADNFFELGGDSLKGMLMVNRYQELLKEKVYISMIFDAVTISETSDSLKKNYPQAVARLLGQSTSPSVNFIKYEISQKRLSEFKALLPKLSPIDASLHKIKCPVLFILSPSRSGSTLLRVMLGGNTQLFAPPELDLLGYSLLSEKNTTNDGSIQALMSIHHIDVTSAKKLYENFVDQGTTVHQFYNYLTTSLNDRILVDKSPDYALDIDVLKRAVSYFECPYFIHLTRHPYATINSKEKSKLDIIPGYLKNYFSSGREFSEVEWLMCHQNILNFLDDIPENKKLTISYESLVKEPDRNIENICRLISVEFQKEMLYPYAEKKNRMTEGIHKEGIMIGDPKFHEFKKIEEKVADNWRSFVKYDFLSDETWKTAFKLGYEPVQAAVYHPIRPAEKKQYYPLSAQQRSMYFLQYLKPDSTAYNLPQLQKINVRGIDKLEDTFSNLIKRHQIFRSSFTLVLDEPAQLIHDFNLVNFKIDVVNINRHESIEFEKYVKPFNLSEFPLLRVVLFCKEKDFWLLIDKHHIICDGTSRIILEKEFEAIYSDINLPDVKTNYIDFVEWKKKTMGQQSGNLQKLFWMNEVGTSYKKIKIPSRNTVEQSSRCSNLKLTLNRGVVNDLKILCKEHNVTLNIFWMTIYSLFVAKISKSKKVAFGTITSARNHRDIENTIGMFVNTIFIKNELKMHWTFHQLLIAMKLKMQKIYNFQDYPFEELVSNLSITRDVDENPLFDTFFIYENFDKTEDLQTNFSSLNTNNSGSSEFFLTLTCHEFKNSLDIHMSFRQDYFLMDDIKEYLRFIEAVSLLVMKDPLVSLKAALNEDANDDIEASSTTLPDFNFE